MNVCPAKTQISLGIRPVWSESSLSTWRKLGSLAIHQVHSEDSDQIGRIPSLIRVFAGRTVILLVLSCRRRLQNVVCDVKWFFESRHDKTNKMNVRPAKTQISLGIRPVWSESSLSTWRKLGSLTTHQVHSEVSDQAGRIPSLIRVVAGRTVILLFFLGFVMSRLI